MDDFVRRTKCSKACAKNITDRVSQMIGQDLRPIIIVECEGFRSLLSYLEPGYTLPSRKNFVNDINRKFEICQDKLKARLESEALCVSLTTDIWTSMATKAYLTVTVHYIDASWKMRNFVLDTVLFPERHTGVNIAEKLKEIAERWGVLRYVLTISHDQASNMEAAVRILTDEYNWQSLPCSAHRLQLCVLAGLSISAIDRLIAAAKKIVGHFSHSVVATVALKEKQNQMNNIDAKKLINSCATRWNSTYEMLERLLKLRWPIVAVLSDESVTKRSDRFLDLKTEQWKLVEDLVPILEQFSVATTFFSEEENVSISSVFAIVHGLLDYLELPREESSPDSKVIRDFKTTVSTQLIERFELTSLHAAHPMLMGSLLDPRFKHITLSKYKEESEARKLKLSLKELMEMYASEDGDGSSPVKPKKQKLTALDKLLGPENLTLEPRSFDNEIEKYLAEVSISRKENPLTWWRENSSRYKSLS